VLSAAAAVEAQPKMLAAMFGDLAITRTIIHEDDTFSILRHAQLTNSTLPCSNLSSFRLSLYEFCLLFVSYKILQPVSENHALTSFVRTRFQGPQQWEQLKSLRRVVSVELV
jgi:hypothetical protein